MLFAAGLFVLNATTYAQNREIGGDVTTSSMYTAGATSDLDFTISAFSPDWEYIDEFSLVFPAGVTINSATQIDFEDAVIAGQTISWDTYFDPEDGDVDFSVNVTVDAAFTGNMSIDWHIEGDYWGDPPNSADGTVVVPVAAPRLEVTPLVLDLGDRPINSWTEPAYFTLTNTGTGSLTVNNVELDAADFFAVVGDFPIMLDAGESAEVGVSATGDAAPGMLTGDFVAQWGASRAVVVTEFMANAYTPLVADVVETATELDVAPAPAGPTSLPMASTRESGGIYKNYILPNDVGSGPNDNDYVYLLEPTTDVLLDLFVTVGTVNFAIYDADFGGEGGPMATNALVQGVDNIDDFELFAGSYYMVGSSLDSWGGGFNVTAMPAPDAVVYNAPLDGAVDITNGDDLEWTFGANTLEYELVLGTTYPPATVVVPWTSDLAEAYTLVNTQPNLQYFWQVNVRNNNDETLGPIWGFTTAITAPAELTATVNDPAESSTTVSATLEWTSPLDRAFNGYNIYRDGMMLNTDPVVGETYTDLGLTRNTTYEYFVTAVFDEGESVPSNTVEITTLGVGNVSGFVYTALNNDPIEGANVRIQGTNGLYSFVTDVDGAYAGQVYAGLYNYTVSATDYDNQTLSGQTVVHNGTLMNDFYLTESPYPVADVVAFELDEDKVQISWGGSTPPPPPPLIAEWLGYDDNGIPTQYWWAGAGAPFSWAINFEPADLEDLEGSSLTKIAIFNTAAPDVNTLNIYQGDLVAGTATIVHTQDLTGLTLEDWNEIDLTVPVPIDITQQLWVTMFSVAPTGGTAASTPILNAQGDWINFGTGWIHMSADLAFDVTWSLRAFATNAANRSVTQLVSKYNKPAYNDGATAALQSTDIVGAKPFRPEYSDRGIADYTVWREKVYQAGALEEIGNTSQLDFVDFDWGTMDWGVYRWAVTANYDGGQTSIPTFSNVLDKDMEVMVDVAVTLNSAEAPGGTMVTFTNLSEPDMELVYETTLDNSGLYTWDMFRRGVYDIEVAKMGYGTVTEMGVEIYDDTSFEWLLEELLSAPAGLYVTPTAFASWGGGTGGGFEEYFSDFEADNGGWVGGSIAGANTFEWGVPANGDLDHAFSGTNVWGVGLTANYAVSQNIYLMRQFDFSAAANPYISMQLLLQTENNWDAMIMEYSTDDGTTWTKLEGVDFYNNTSTFGPMAPPKWSGDAITEYQLFETMMPDLAGLPNVWLRFRFQSDGSLVREGVAIDDVTVGDMSRSVASVKSFDTYKVFLDGQLVAETADNEYQFDVATLTPYETYTAGVAAVFTTGQSPTAEKDFIYIPCGDYAAPTAFAAAQVEGTLDIMLEWTNVDAAALDTIMALAIYRNGEEYELIDFEDGAVSTFLDEDLEFGMYTYCVTYIYDSGAETCQGVTCSDEIEIDGNAGVDGMVMQAAYLGGDPIEGASVMLVNVDDPDIMFEFFTDATGAYEGMIIAGTYDYTVSAMGYTSVMLEDVEIVLNATVTNDFELVEFPYPPIMVVAEEITDNNVLITWHNPMYAPFEPVMETFDAGIPASWTVVTGGNTADTWYMETPAGNPQTAGASLDGTNFAYVDSDEAGSSADLDEILYSPVVNAATAEALYLTFDQYYRHLGTGTFGKVDVYDGTDWVTVLNQVATAGAWDAPDQQMIDVSMYANEEFQVRFHYYDATSWAWYWALDNVAITDEVTRSGAPVLSNTEAPERGLFGYEVWRTTCETGDLEFLGLTLDTLFNDNTWGTAEAGIYKWGVRAVYDEENYSEVIFSNCLDKDMVTTVSVTVTTNSTDGPEETDVMFTNTSEPELGLVYETELDETGFFAWDEFRKGVYDIYVEKNGFAPISITDYLIDGPEAFTWLLEELLLPVSDLYVTPTGFATWREGGVIPFEPYAADFEADEMGWEIQGNVNGWQWGNTGSLSSTFMSFAGNSTNFIAVNADAAGSGGTPIVALTKSPMLDLSSADEVYVSFDYRLLNDDMSIHYSIGGGDPILLEQLAGNTAWTTNYMVMLPDEALASDVQILFLYEEGSTWGYGGAVDNVVVTDEPMTRELEYYKIWLDGVFVADVMENFYQYDVTDLVEGEEYYSEVAAVYSNGMSAKMSYVWTYYSCENYPGPENLAGTVEGQDVTLTWGSTPPPPPPSGGFEDDFESYSDFVIDFAPWTNVDVDGSDTYGMNGIDWTNQYAAQSFIVFNPSATTPAVTDMTAHSGDKFVACFASTTPPNNDWLISPMTAVEAGSFVNFWAKSYTADYGLERFKVGVSTTGTDPADFTIITPGAYVEAPVEAWTEYSYDLSAYAGQEVYVGIQCVSNDAFIFMVDDFSIGAETASFAFNPSSTEIGRGTREIGEAVPAIGHNTITEDATIGGVINRVPGASKSLGVNRALLHDNGPLVNSEGTGSGGADESVLQGSLGMTTLGAGIQFAVGNHMADDFVVDETWTVDEFTFYGYQTNSGDASTMTGGYLQIYDGNPSSGGALVWGDMTTNRMTSTQFSNIYRVSETTGGTTARPIMEIVCETPGLVLEPGTYWVEYTLDGSATSGPWAPPITITGEATTGNALQLTSDGWAPFTDGGSLTAQGMPFLINGTADGGGGGDFETGPVAGVNVYRDGMLIAEMVQDTFYVDPDVDYGMYTYCVTYVYESGAESCSEACVDVELAFPCDAPKELVGEYLWTEEAWGSMIEWNSPQDAIAEWLYYDDGVNVDGIGGPATFTWAVKFDPAQLAEYDGASLTKIEIYNRVAGSNELRIYEGTNAATLLHTQTLSGLGLETWEEVDLTDAVMIDVTKELWIAVNTTNGAAYPAGCGNYTGNPNSDLITLDGVLWEHLNDLALPYTWNLRGFVTTMAGATAALPMDKPVDQISNNGASLATSGKPSYQTAGPASSSATADRELDVFNVYRSLGDDNYELISTVPFEEGVTAYSYFDTDVEAQVGYNYQVTAFYTYTNGTCESDPAMALVNPEDDFVYVFVTNTNEFNLNNTRVYPNPANHNVVIESAQMNRITVMSALGQVVIDRAIEGQMRYDLNTSTYEAGVYLIRIETNEGAVTKRLTIVR
jgi:hypothetical protein